MSHIKISVVFLWDFIILVIIVSSSSINLEYETWVWWYSIHSIHNPIAHTLKYNMNQNQTTKLNPKMFKYGYEYTFLRIDNYNNKIIKNTQLPTWNNFPYLKF